MYKRRFGQKGQVHFADEHEYYSALGYLAKSASISLAWEHNEDQGAWGNEGRIHIYDEEFPYSENFKLTAGRGRIASRVNCNEYVANIIKDHQFAEDTRAQCIDAIRKTVPKEWLSAFDRGLHKKTDIMTADEIIAGPFESYPNIEEPLKEGAVKQVTQRVIERNKKAREICIKYHGTQCSVCDIDFEKEYPGIGDGYIHIHHLNEVASATGEYEIDPVKDLLPVCPNCHAMIHKKKPAYTIEEMKVIFQSS